MKGTQDGEDTNVTQLYCKKWTFLCNSFFTLSQLSAIRCSFTFTIFLWLSIDLYNTNIKDILRFVDFISALAIWVRKA